MNRRFRWTRHGSCSLNWRSSAALLALLGSPAATYATTEIDCDSTADFCTGDPCVTADVLEITASPCTLDFGSATLKIDKKIRVAVDGGTLSLTAANIEVNAKIDAKHIKSSNSNGSQVSLTSTGSITVQRKIDVSARLTPGAIALDAGGNIQLSHQLVARAKGRNTAATGGTVTIDAAGTVTSTKRGKIVTRGKKSFTNAGDVSVSGDAGADLDGRIEARSS